MAWTTSIATTIAARRRTRLAISRARTSFPLSQIYTGPLNYTDPVTGLTAPYYQICQGCVRPSGIGAITITNLGYNVYQAVIPTLNKRFSNRWQMNASATFQTNPGYQPLGSYTNPTGVQFTDGRSTIARYLLRVSGTYALAWGITASGNLTVNDGATRTLSINGPGGVYGGNTTSGAQAANITYEHAELPAGRHHPVRGDEAARPGRAEGVHVPRGQEPVEGDV